MNYLKNKSAGFYISMIGTIAALIGLILYRGVSRAEMDIVFLLGAAVIIQIVVSVLMIFVKNFIFWSLAITVNAVLVAIALINSLFTQVDAIGYVFSGLYEFSTIQPYIVSVIPMAAALILYIAASYSGLEKDNA